MVGYLDVLSIVIDAANTAAAAAALASTFLLTISTNLSEYFSKNENTSCSSVPPVTAPGLGLAPVGPVDPPP